MDSSEGRKPSRLRCISIRSMSAPASSSADRAIGMVERGTDRCCSAGLFEATCVRSRAETRESIAQNLEGEKEGARDRVVTELDLQLL